MNLQKDYYLENSRVLLKPLVIEDTNKLANIAINEPDLWNYTLNKPNSEKKLNTYITNVIADRKNGVSYAFSVYDKQKQAYAGCTRVYEINSIHKTCAIGYTWYSKNFQGTGLNKNCKYLLFKFAFEELLMERIQFRADKNNIRSINAIKSLGCKEEGGLRSNMYKPDGTRRNSMILSILKNEWLNSEKKKLKDKIEIHH
ncbi:RimJ/RimL family protein N-acetyltransferase [Tenacibaculum gallaicum]|uniref:RimJ/RimL family protein N-acetyltransferase n=1 Tax=Tenacibaculum gallaicum TaxID=561505 RepID=A0A3E0HR82_9FLAO|nr:GNAT family protein [Tenacibaculum gallaicum]REH48901.1 RimJ/RimL family protein N-acetyltransferase [Tenacibaculum gallaicum]